MYTINEVKLIDYKKYNFTVNGKCDIKTLSASCPTVHRGGNIYLLDCKLLVIIIKIISHHLFKKMVRLNII